MLVSFGKYLPFKSRNRFISKCKFYRCLSIDLDSACFDLYDTGFVRIYISLNNSLAMVES
jgi:hypothetical protein